VSWCRAARDGVVGHGDLLGINHGYYEGKGSRFGITPTRLMTDHGVTSGASHRGNLWDSANTDRAIIRRFENMKLINGIIVPSAASIVIGPMTMTGTPFHL
jgi:hypothetical protein